MGNNELVEKQEALPKEFSTDSKIVGEQTERFLELVYPSYLCAPDDIESLLDAQSSLRLESMTFFRITSCTVDNVEDVFESVNKCFEKLFSAFHSINISIAYGLVSHKGVTNLVLGVYHSGDVEAVRAIAQGMLSGIGLEAFTPNFSDSGTPNRSYGVLSGVPSLFVTEQKQDFSLSSIMRSLNGQDYTLLFIARPVSQDIVTQNITDLISVRDQAFAVSKRNVARSNSYSETNSQTETKTTSETKSSVAGPVGTSIGMIVGAVAGSVVPGVGTALGGLVGGGLGTVIGNLVGKGRSTTESYSYSESISEAITAGTTISGDIQNGFALELMHYADSAIERLKAGRNNGIWQTAIVYSGGTEMARNIIRGCLSGELSKPDAEKLPMLAFEPEKSTGEVLRIPAFLGDKAEMNPLCSLINSAELGLLCTVPTESVPDFELRHEKRFPLLASRSTDDKIKIGTVVDGKRPLANMPFGLSEGDLNKHLFVCGITGSGKTTTVKKILAEAKKPFLVIEAAKKEYRNIALETMVYTPGKPEINAPQINPFYILPGISPQMHIDFLKDLFNASFSFYGPMPYILEKCLHTVYRNKGWDLTLGYHPLLSDSQSPTNLFNIERICEQYAKGSHKYLFPTMRELKDEVARYIDEELKYDGEVAGNVKTAMKVRLESLCVGAKGYTFNTNEFLDCNDGILEQNVVLELEGLADDSDKAFCVGLVVIFVNEYRHVEKERWGSKKTGLKHLLVIEEAHRLLKNVDTERPSEAVGNPKGKAVEHFTNMIAEMRSYGQGVIVAEQIPTKLAPDVIKNSSTKIVHRLVSADDQQTMANTVGMTGDDAMQLGALETGYAYCHKEGMALPAPVKIADGFVGSDGELQNLDVYVSDEFSCSKDRFRRIDLNVLHSSFDVCIKQKVLAFVNTLMIESEDRCVEACDRMLDYLKKEIKGNEEIALTPVSDADVVHHLCAEYLAETILSWMVRGAYRTKTLPDDDFIALLKGTLNVSSKEKIVRLKESLRSLYPRDISSHAKVNVAALIRRSLKDDTDIAGTIRGYFVDVSDDVVCEIERMVGGGQLA